jgi:outer membrane protein assembly factor BamB
MTCSGRILGILVASQILGLSIGTSCAVAQVRINVQRRGNNGIGVQGAIVLNQAPFTMNSQDLSQGKNLFATNRQMTRALRLAKTLFNKEKYAEGILLLQKVILDSPEDFAFYPDTQMKTIFRSHKTEALKMLGALPASGLADYEEEYGPTARQQFEEAVVAGDIVAVEEVARKFFHTIAGTEAAYWLGSHQMDQGNPLSAGMHFDRLRQSSRTSNKWEPMLTLKTAVCWEQAGFPERSRQTLIDLKSSNRNGRLELGDRAIRLFQDNADARSWLLNLMGQRSRVPALEQSQWTLFRGNPQRNASSPQASPVWDSQWIADTILHPDAVNSDQLAQVESQLNLLENNYRTNNRLLLPAGHPLVIGERVVFRTYHNLRAVHLRTGEMLWETVKRDRTFETLADQARSGSNPSLRQQQQFLMQRAWNDLTSGTFSSDGKFLYALEELGFVRHVNQPTRDIGDTMLLRKYNKLMAFELSSGKLKWEIGGSVGDHSLPLAGYFFLGPPLVLGKQLFVLAELNGEIRLLVLHVQGDSEASRTAKRYDVKVLWMQSLLQTIGSVQHSPRRRLAGLSPSFDSGVLVCPTASGAVVAVDLARRLLLWGYAYRTKNAGQFENRQRPMMGFGSGSYILPFNMNEDRWLDSAAAIVEGKVLLTPSDSDELHCLNLVDGTVLWKRPRGQGLYLACASSGKAVVVGRTHIHAWKLSDGQEAWKEPIPISMPSGRGFRTDELYRLPLSTGEIASVDLGFGHIIARSKSRTGHIPGNLVASGGAIVSQTINAVVGYKSLSDLNAEISGRMQDNPNDPEALALRGEMKLHQGDETGGVADLTHSISMKPDAHSQTVLIATLLEGLRRDFDKYKNSTEQVRHLISDPRQRSTFLRLSAEGLQQIGEHRAAFSEYLQLAIPGTVTPRLEEVNGLLSVRSDRLILPRLAKIYYSASADDQAAMDREFERLLTAAANTVNPQALQKFLEAFSTFPIAEAARRKLADRLDERVQALELELLLMRLRRSGDRSTSGFATARLASLFINLNHPEFAIPFIRELDKKYSNLVCLDNKTGKQLAEQWFSDEAISGLIANDASWPNRRIEATHKTVQSSISRRIPVPVEGSSGLFFENWSIELNENMPVFLQALDKRGEEQWNVRSQPETNQNITFYGNYARVHGHLLAAMFGNYFVVYDTLAPYGSPKALWRGHLYDKELVSGVDGFRPRRGRVVLPNGRFGIGLIDAIGRPIGKVGPVSDDFLCYQAGSSLYAADPLTGETLWKLRNIPHGSGILVDENVVTVLSQSSTEAILLRAVDGEEIGRRTLPPGNERLLVTGRYVVSRKQQGNQQSLRVFDFSEEKTVWRKEFAERALITLIKNEELAVLEPNGTFHILKIADGTTLLQSEVQRNNRISQIFVRRSPERYFLMTREIDPKPFEFNIQGLRPGNPLVNGYVYGFDRNTGKKIWVTKIEHQAFEHSQSDHLPVLIFCSNAYPTTRRGGFSRGLKFNINILDSRNGRMIYENRMSEPSGSFRLQEDPDEKTIKITFPRSEISLATTDKPLDPPATIDNKTETPEPESK